MKPPVINGVLRMEDRLGMFGPRRDFTDEDIDYIKNLLKTYEAISYELLISEGTQKIGRLKTIAITDYLLNSGEIFEPICGFFSLTAGGRI